LPYEEAALVAKSFGLELSRSLVDKLTMSCAQSCREHVATKLASEPGSRSTEVKQHEPWSGSSARKLVLQVDGVCVLGRPEQGQCPGLEIKSAVLYPQDSPSQRWMVAERCSAEAFLPLLAGLLQQAGVTSADRLIGLGDGASWIENAFAYLQAVHITDVYHACEYLDTVMQALGWDETARQEQRRNWYRGQLNARDWLAQHLPDPNVWLAWDEHAQTALRYLETRLDSMDYARFSQLGYPIGSGQVEAMNKAVIGHRMKRSGMHWSKEGAASMAALRAQTCAKFPLVSFEDLRFHAFALPDSS